MSKTGCYGNQNYLYRNVPLGKRSQQAVGLYTQCRISTIYTITSQLCNIIYTYVQPNIHIYNLGNGDNAQYVTLHKHVQCNYNGGAVTLRMSYREMKMQTITKREKLEKMLKSEILIQNF